jgi:hypothetical protein
MPNRASIRFPTKPVPTGLFRLEYTLAKTNTGGITTLKISTNGLNDKSRAAIVTIVESGRRHP